MRKRILLAAAGTTIAAAAGLFAGTTSAGATPTSPVVGHTYVNDNPAGPNTIAAFDRHADGSLTPTKGSPFPAGGTGLGAGLGSQGAIQASPDHRFLLAVDAGSNQISVLRVNPNGVPTPVGSPVSSDGIKPVSIAINRFGLVYVANTGSATVAGNYTGFLLTPLGRLIPLPYTTVATPAGSNIGDVFFNSTGNQLVGTRGDTPSVIDSFNVRLDARLDPAPGSPFAAQALGPIGAEFRPTNPSQLYVSNAHAGAGLGTVSAFQLSRSGVLSSIGNSPVADGQTAPCWVEITHDGKYLFAVNTGSGNISSYSIGHDGALTLIGTTNFKNSAGPQDARLSPDGRTLSVTSGRGLVVTTFAVNGGTLTELPSSPVALPAGTSAVGIVVL